MSAPPSDDRRYPAHPLLGVGALIFRGERILLVERAKDPLKGWWSLPGGLVEPGERLHDAVCREVLEETGLAVRPVAFFEVFERIMADPQGRPEYHYVLIDYICEITGGQASPATDVSRLAWATQSELASYHLTTGTQPVIERAFARRSTAP